MLSAISSNLARLRQEKGISQRQAAEHLGISQALLSHYENGIREPGLDFICRACEYYHVSADYLLGRTSIRDTASLDAQSVLNQTQTIQEPAAKIGDDKSMSRFYSQVLQNSIYILFDLLNKMEDEVVSTMAYQFIGGAIYRLYRHLTRYAPDGLATLYDVDNLDATVEAASADMTLCEMEYTYCLKRRKDEKKPFPPTGYRALEKCYPAAYRSLFELVYHGGKRNQAMVEAHQKEGIRAMRERRLEHK